MRRHFMEPEVGLLVFEVPIGWLAVTAARGKLIEIRSLPLRADLEEGLRRDYRGFSRGEENLLARGRQQLEDYFAGRRGRFDLPLDLAGESDFALRVLGSLAGVPFGETLTYGELARRAGHPGAARAIGRVMAGNPLPIVLPCHRVVGAGGVLTGYSGGAGLETKEWLLAFERRLSHSD